ncbi:hypothetical protein M885DRAFT_206103 [Pelagophyceae sp. CCMP2097]|nr:hypothetical protein M885DRAFT_206103 [Pelagophyceae sp. CCMP2097]
MALQKGLASDRAAQVATKEALRGVCPEGTGSRVRLPPMDLSRRPPRRRSRVLSPAAIARAGDGTPAYPTCSPPLEWTESPPRSNFWRGFGSSGHRPPGRQKGTFRGSKGRVEARPRAGEKAGPKGRTLGVITGWHTLFEALGAAYANLGGAKRKRHEHPRVLIGAEPVAAYVARLQHELGRFALFFFDEQEPDAVGVVFRAKAFHAAPFSAADSARALPVKGGKVLPNILEILHDVKRLGTGLVERVDLHD